VGEQAISRRRDARAEHHVKALAQFAFGGQAEGREALVENVVVEKGEIDIIFSYPPSSEDVCRTSKGQGRGEEVLGVQGAKLLRL
jgi:hypothetical protein